jgi:methionyl-tRNA formyltransferase
MTPLNIVAFAYHEVGVVCLEELIRLGVSPQLVVTYPDSPHENIWFRSVKTLAEKEKIPLIITENPNQEGIIQQIRKTNPDLIFSFYFRQMLGQEILNLARKAALNMHGSLLPKFRGRCPINWVLIHGEKETGVTLHHMTQKPDQGDIVSQRRVAILDNDTVATLAPKIAGAAGILLRNSWPMIESASIPRFPQDERQATYFSARRPEDGLIRWDRPAAEIHNLIRAVTHPYPGAFTHLGGRKLFIWKARPLNGRTLCRAPGTFPFRSRSRDFIANPSGARLSRSSTLRVPSSVGEWPNIKTGEVFEIRSGQGALFSTARGALLAEIAQWEGGPENRADLLLQTEGVTS